MTRLGLALRYGAFAVIATLANLGVQRAILTQGDSGMAFALAGGAGTLVGLVLKYILDKKWIFFAVTASAQAEGKTFCGLCWVITQ